MGKLAKTEAALLSDLRGLIEQARQHVAQTANSTLTMLYWKVGERIGREVLRGQRAEYGEQIVSTLSTQLVLEYGKGCKLIDVDGNEYIDFLCGYGPITLGYREEEVDDALRSPT